jgi:hypothetical protein
MKHILDVQANLMDDLDRAGQSHPATRDRTRQTKE